MLIEGFEDSLLLIREKVCGLFCEENAYGQGKHLVLHPKVQESCEKC